MALKLAQQLAAKADVPVIVTSGDSARAEAAEQAGLLCFQKAVPAIRAGSGYLKSFAAKGLSGGI